MPECSNLGWGAFNHLFSGRGDDDTDVTDCADLFGVRVVKTFGTNDMVAKPALNTDWASPVLRCHRSEGRLPGVLTKSAHSSHRSE